MGILIPQVRGERRDHIVQHVVGMLDGRRADTESIRAAIMHVIDCYSDPYERELGISILLSALALSAIAELQ